MVSLRHLGVLVGAFGSLLSAACTGNAGTTAARSTDAMDAGKPLRKLIPLTGRSLESALSGRTMLMPSRGSSDISTIMQQHFGIDGSYLLETDRVKVPGNYQIAGTEFCIETISNPIRSCRSLFRDEAGHFYVSQRTPVTIPPHPISLKAQSRRSEDALGRH